MKNENTSFILISWVTLADSIKTTESEKDHRSEKCRWQITIFYKIIHMRKSILVVKDILGSQQYRESPSLIIAGSKSYQGIHIFFRLNSMSGQSTGWPGCSSGLFTHLQAFCNNWFSHGITELCRLEVWRWSDPTHPTHPTPTPKQGQLRSDCLWPCSLSFEYFQVCSNVWPPS